MLSQEGPVNPIPPPATREPRAELVHAVFSKGCTPDVAASNTKRLLEMIDARDLQKLIDWLHTGNPISRRAFELVTGTTLPKMTGLVAFLEAWTGKTLPPVTPRVKPPPPGVTSQDAVLNAYLATLPSLTAGKVKKHLEKLTRVKGIVMSRAALISDCAARGYESRVSTDWNGKSTLGAWSAERGYDISITESRFLEHLKSSSSGQIHPGLELRYNPPPEASEPPPPRVNPEPIAPAQPDPLEQASLFASQ